MTAPPTATPTAPGHRDPAVHAATPAQLHWLEGELAHWQAEGLLAPEAAHAIRGRYVASRRFTLSRIVLTLGACFVGLGLIWLVASNLDAMSPLARFGLMVAIWLGLVVGVRGAGEPRAPGWATRHPRSSGALRLLAAAAFGAVVFQAAQSLQVPAYEPLLVGVWGLGALLWAYAVRGVAPLVLAVALLAFWFVWQVVERRAAGPSRCRPRSAAAGARRRVGRGGAPGARLARPGRPVARGRCGAGAARPVHRRPALRVGRGRGERRPARRARGRGRARGRRPRARRPRRPARGRARRPGPGAHRRPVAVALRRERARHRRPPDRGVGAGRALGGRLPRSWRAGTPCSAGCATPRGSPGSPRRRWSSS